MRDPRNGLFIMWKVCRNSKLEIIGKNGGKNGEKWKIVIKIDF